jgi:hypothetical protein
MIKKIKYLLYLVVFSGFSSASAGSYEDFFVAIKQDNAAVVRDLIGRGFDANTLNPDGQFGLILAIREPSLHVAEALIAAPETRIEVRNSVDESPLMLAALKGFAGICNLLIKRDADVNKPGWTPLHYAATGGHAGVVKLLLENHAYVDAASPNGSTPLMMAAMYGSPAAVQTLLDAGADPTLKNELGLTAIDFARQGLKADSAEIIAASIRRRSSTGAW